jgi:hypothetical protein
MVAASVISKDRTFELPFTEGVGLTPRRAEVNLAADMADAQSVRDWQKLNNTLRLAGSNPWW